MAFGSSLANQYILTGKKKFSFGIFVLTLVAAMHFSPRFLPWISAALILSATASSADTIVLKSGEKLEGSVISSNETTIEAEVQVSAAIKDTRTLQKSDIQEIIKADPAEAAYAAIRDIRLGINSLAASDYDKTIYGKLKPFLDKYPENSHAASVKATFDAFKAEQTRVKLGDVKLNNEWLTKEQIAKDKYNIGASVLFQQIQASAAQLDYIAALNQFSTLEKNYPGAKILPDAVEYAQKLIPGVRKTIENATLVYERDIAAREQGVALTPDHKKPELLAAIAAEDAQTNAALDAAKTAGVIWTPIYPRSKRSLEDLAKTADSETTRLAAIKTGDMRASINESTQGRLLLNGGDLTGAEAQFTAASTHWAANELIQENATLLAAAKEAAKATPTPSPSATPAASAKPAAATSAATPAASVAPKPASTPIPPPPEEKPPFYLTVPGAVIIFAVIAALVVAGMIFSRRGKAKLAEENNQDHHANV